MGVSLPSVVSEASFRISCGDFDFRLRYRPGLAVADFPSLGMLTKAGKISRDITGLIADLPPLPPPLKLPATNTEKTKAGEEVQVLVAVKARPIGKISFNNGKARFIPTPLRFFRKV